MSQMITPSGGFSPGTLFGYGTQNLETSDDFTWDEVTPGFSLPKAGADILLYCRDITQSMPIAALSYFSSQDVSDSNRALSDLTDQGDVPDRVRNYTLAPKPDSACAFYDGVQTGPKEMLTTYLISSEFWDMTSCAHNGTDLVSYNLSFTVLAPSSQPSTRPSVSPKPSQLPSMFFSNTPSVLEFRTKEPDVLEQRTRAPSPLTSQSPTSLEFRTKEPDVLEQRTRAPVSQSPTNSMDPMTSPSEIPSKSTNPTDTPSTGPSETVTPSTKPSRSPSFSLSPSIEASDSPTISLPSSTEPTQQPTQTMDPMIGPSSVPTISLSILPSKSMNPSIDIEPSQQPTQTMDPITGPSSVPTTSP
eukprot:scaffold148219_cov54-Attheya_sp.AAC.1